MDEAEAHAAFVWIPSYRHLDKAEARKLQGNHASLGVEVRLYVLRYPMKWVVRRQAKHLNL